MSVTVHYIVYFYPSLVWKLSDLNSSPGAANLHGFVTIPFTFGQRSLCLDPVCTFYLHLNLSAEEVNHPLIIYLTVIKTMITKIWSHIFYLFILISCWHESDIKRLKGGRNHKLFRHNCAPAPVRHFLVSLRNTHTCATYLACFYLVVF